MTITVCRRFDSCSNTVVYPDHLWAVATALLEELKRVGPGAAPFTLTYVWERGFPEGYNVCEGAICSLHDKPEEYLPPVVPTAANPQRPITADSSGNDFHM